MGQTVVGLDNFATGFQTNLDDVLASLPQHADRFRLVTGDIRSLPVCRTACDGVDYVLHQAALGSVPRSLDDPATSNEVNVDGTLNMFMAARDAGVSRIVYASSCAVYGDSTDCRSTKRGRWFRCRRMPRPRQRMRCTRRRSLAPLVSESSGCDTSTSLAGVRIRTALTPPSFRAGSRAW